MSAENPICKHCGQPVVVNASSYNVFEQMHWLCFHIVFEHNADPDVACQDPGCPWWHIDVYKNKLVELGQEPSKVIEEAINKRWHLE